MNHKLLHQRMARCTGRSQAAQTFHYFHYQNALFVSAVGVEGKRQSKETLAPSLYLTFFSLKSGTSASSLS